jgi:tRNA 2-thiouridine synthesizing protein A
MSPSPDIITVDVRGEICPVPLIKATEAMKAASPGQNIAMLTDFPPAILVVTNAAIKNGWDVKIESMTTSEWKITLVPIGGASITS